MPNPITMKKEEIRQLLQHVRPYFKDRLGKFTHKRISDEWYFHALGFIRDDLTYVFGFNMGFFGSDGQNGYGAVGMSVTVRANGVMPEVRQGYLDFFAKELRTWTNRPFERYSSDRGGEGLLITRYLDVEGKTHQEIIDFLMKCIDTFQPIYESISKKPNVFKAVMRAGMPWDEPIVSLAREHV